MVSGFFVAKAQKKNRQWEILAVWEFTQGLDKRETTKTLLEWMCANAQNVFLSTPCPK